MKHFIKYFIISILIIAMFVSCSNKKIHDETSNVTDNSSEQTTTNAIEETVNTTPGTIVENTTTGFTETTTKPEESEPQAETTTVSTTVITTDILSETNKEDATDSEYLFDNQNPNYQWYPVEPLAEKVTYKYIELDNQNENERFVGIAVYVTKSEKDYPYKTGTRIDFGTKKNGAGELIYHSDGYEMLYMVNEHSIDVSDRMVMASKHIVGNNKTHRMEAYYICDDAESMYYYIDPIFMTNNDVPYIVATNKCYKGSEFTGSSIGIAGTNIVNENNIKLVACVRVRSMSKTILPDFFEADEMFIGNGFVNVGDGYGFWNDTDMTDAEILIQDFGDFTIEFAYNEASELLFLYENYDRDYIRRPVIDYDKGYCYNDYHPYTHVWNDPTVGMDR